MATASAVATRRALRALTPLQRAQRRQDLLLASDLMRRQIGRDLAGLQPQADRALIWVDAALWLRNRWREAPPRGRGAVLALAAAAGLVGVGSAGSFMLRHARWLRNALAAWRLWRRLRP